MVLGFVLSRYRLNLSAGVLEIAEYFLSKSSRSWLNQRVSVDVTCSIFEGQQLAFNPSNSKLEISLAFFQQDVENIMKAYSLLAGFCKTAWVCLVRCKTARLSGCFYFGAFRGRRLLPSLRE
ncbi:unnamed protein product [Onchocerca flexuosa]|uniref:Uncharacterized protein n=1 Tax=Onchocerca flexuosa TaxID=387005 RepID=A0A183HCM9_9BILA|nr:unnamed protein product [Onchocerca flexuosa]